MTVVALARGWQRLAYPPLAAPLSGFQATPDGAFLIAWKIGTGRGGSVSIYSIATDTWSVARTIPNAAVPVAFTPPAGGVVGFMDSTTWQFYTLPRVSIAFSRGFGAESVASALKAGFNNTTFGQNIGGAKMFWSPLYPGASLVTYSDLDSANLIVGFDIAGAQPDFVLSPPEGFLGQYGQQNGMRTQNVRDIEPSYGYVPGRVYETNFSGTVPTTYGDLVAQLPANLAAATRFATIFYGAGGGAFVSASVPTRGRPLPGAALAALSSATPNTPFQQTILGTVSQLNQDAGTCAVLGTGSYVQAVYPATVLDHVNYVPFVDVGAYGVIGVPFAVAAPAGFTSQNWRIVNPNNRPIIYDDIGNMYALNLAFADFGPFATRNYVRNRRQ